MYDVCIILKPIFIYIFENCFFLLVSPKYSAEKPRTNILVRSISESKLSLQIYFHIHGLLI